MLVQAQFYSVFWSCISLMLQLTCETFAPKEICSQNKSRRACLVTYLRVANIHCSDGKGIWIRDLDTQTDVGGFHIVCLQNVRFPPSVPFSNLCSLGRAPSPSIICGCPLLTDNPFNVFFNWQGNSLSQDSYFMVTLAFERSILSKITTVPS